MSSNDPELTRTEETDEEERVAVQLSDSSRATRRSFIATGAAVWATASLAGCTGSNAPEQAAAIDSENVEAAQEAKNYVVTDDIGAGSQGVPNAAFMSACAPTRKFVPGMQAVWYIGVYDPETGEHVTNDTIDTMQVEFTNRNWDPVELTWAGDDEEHPSDEWNGSTVLPSDADPGTVQYQLTVSGGDGNYQNVGVVASEFEVLGLEDTVTLAVSNYTYAISSPARSNGFVSACGPEWQYAPGMTIAFAANVFDAQTGKEPGPDLIEGVRVRFPTGKRPDMNGIGGFTPIELEWQGGDGEHADEVWEGTLELPEDARTGTYEYEIFVDAPARDIHDVGIATDTFTVI